MYCMFLFYFAITPLLQQNINQNKDKNIKSLNKQVQTSFVFLKVNKQYYRTRRRNHRALFLIFHKEMLYGSKSLSFVKCLYDALTLV